MGQWLHLLDAERGDRDCHVKALLVRNVTANFLLTNPGTITADSDLFLLDENSTLGMLCYSIWKELRELRAGGDEGARLADKQQRWIITTRPAASTPGEGLTGDVQATLFGIKKISNHTVQITAGDHLAWTLDEKNTQIGVGEKNKSNVQFWTWAPA
ncbi:hypothetical protein FIBSPDRAFT_1050706 [Athelia psychrophila]|uniref:Uncharacterized protein n=1 Tax=Athelia psychrophila TaxID=1759441 RepID=A0A166AFZ2_9AGAM|nr:hypothetical protein FIBSPDRAFT_1050706 [Fibularhizoctonia sp. CBS 109695]